ncbi:Autophagy-related protein like [Actinidia chinensis var. chinensis]|uniref:Autophagy-related protein like n=1 Tax=Actinidia chinensis var. chinensis TaxID=1590841 RepID=A0A2R6RBG2_ACTCC|nr:Autophagy-related protein like [Actinidia chinensis var. chinensis]
MKKTLESNKTTTTTNRFFPNSLRFISSCIKTVSSNVRSAGASVAGSISGDSDEHRKDQVLWASFDKVELGPSSIKHVLLLGYSNGFQVLDVEDAPNFSELVSRRDDPVTFLQMQPTPSKSEGHEGFITSHPLLLVVASDETRSSGPMQNARDVLVRDGYVEPQMGNLLNSPTVVRFYSLRSHNYVHVLRFRSTVYMVRCSPQIVAVGLAAQIYCFDALTLESKFSVLTYPVPQLVSPGLVGVNIGNGPMAVGPRWLAYASNNPLSSNTGRLSPQSLSPSPGVSPSTSPSNGSLVARYAMESSKQLASGLMNLGDKGYKTFTKYYHDLLPDGSSSPVSSNSGWKVGRAATQSTETDTTGTVVIRDFVSKSVVSQFRAHTSPISALCFDPSGTLLVTASVHGNNINVFRIMPSQNGSGTRSYDWSCSHVHLYKLHRGMTSAVIQDICFSQYSQWVAIVSSRGTCHIFVLSPFGGETGLQIQNSHVDGPSLIPVLSQPWWSSSSLMMSQQSCPSPPAPITLSVVSRIRLGNSGWLNTVSNAASSAAGKVSVPSGSVAAIFHSSVHHHMQPAPSNVNALEHLLVYSPSGNVIQYELLPSVGGEQVESTSRTGAGPLVQMQEEELRVKFEPVQWWDVCRRVDWLEKEECIYGINPGGQEVTSMDASDYEDNDTGEKDLVKQHEHSRWYLSNAEVQIPSGKIPVWQKSKICFFRISFLGDEEQNLTKDHIGREIEIEKIPVHEVEVKRKDLLPVFDRFHRIHSEWSNDSGLVVGKYSTSSSTSHGGKEKFSEGSLGTSAAVHDLDQADSLRPYPRIVLDANENDGVKGKNAAALLSHAVNRRSFNRADVSTSPEPSASGISFVEENYVMTSPSSPKISALSTGKTIAREGQSSSSVVTSEASNASSNRSDFSMNLIDEGPVHEDMQDPIDFGQYFEEGYCKASTHDECAELTEAVTDVDSSNSPCDKEKYEEDGDDDDMLGGVFAFSEEG